MGGTTNVMTNVNDETRSRELQTSETMRRELQTT